MSKQKIELVTMNDIKEFVNIVAALPGEIKLVDGREFCVNGKSLLGVAASIEWDELYCVSENDIYNKIKKFCVN